MAEPRPTNLKRCAAWLRTLAAEHERGLASGITEQLRTIADRIEGEGRAADADHPGSTKKIRIAVAVTSQGNWNATAWGGPAFAPGDTDADFKEAAWAGMGDAPGVEGLCWVEAEIPLPEDSVTVQGVAGPIEATRD
jgi:hypothetical protein